jgi:hypothetical protein
VAPASHGVYRGRQVEVDEYGMGDAVSIAPFAIQIALNRPPGFQVYLRYALEAAPLSSSTVRVEGVAGTFSVLQGSIAPLADCLRSHPHLMAHVAENPYFYMAIDPADHSRSGTIALFPFQPWALGEPETVEHWSTLLAFGIDLADALEDRR